MMRDEIHCMLSCALHGRIAMCVRIDKKVAKHKVYECRNAKEEKR